MFEPCWGDNIFWHPSRLVLGLT